MGRHKPVVVRRRGGSSFKSNSLNLQQLFTASEKLIKKSGGKLTLDEALEKINEAQFKREALLRKRLNKS